MIPTILLKSPTLTIQNRILIQLMGKAKIVSFKNEILESLQEDIKKWFDSEFEFFKTRCEDLVVKSNAILRLEDEIIN